MGEFPDSLNKLNSILVSRNRPLALVVGVAGFLGSHLAQHLIKKGVQVIGIDDFSTGQKENISELVKDKDFHLINSSIVFHYLEDKNVLVDLELPRLDYAFFVADSEDYRALLTVGLQNFLTFLKKTRDSFYKKEEKELIISTEKPRICLVSSIELYNNKLDPKNHELKEAEIRFAKYIKYHKLNGRVIRLSGVYGPRMHFRELDPIIRLIQASLLDELQKEQTALDFSTRALFVDDAVDLLIKSVLSGSTAQKIYDGANPQPIKIEEIKQVLLDPVWHEQKNFAPTELPPWPTPNLLKTMKEVSWKPRTSLIESLKKTVAFFKENEVKVPQISEEESKGEELYSPIYLDKESLKKWSFKNYENLEEVEQEEKKGKGEGKIKGKGKSIKQRIFIFGLIFLIFYSLVLPLGFLAIGAFNIRNHVKSSAKALEKGDFKKAEQEINLASYTVDQSKDLISSLVLLKRLGIFAKEIDRADEMISLVGQGVEGVKFATSGTQALFTTTKIISGEDPQDPRPIYQQAQKDLTTATQKISQVKAKLSDEDFLSSYPSFISERARDLSLRLNLYANLADKARAASFLLPQITAIDSKKSYLVLLQNNLELRPGGGFIGSYAKLDFEGGRLRNIKVDDIYNLDGGLQAVIPAPELLRKDLGVDRLFLRDSNLEPDFPTSARTAEFFYKREAGEQVAGVIALDLTASAKLLDAVGGLNLPEYNEKVDGSNLFERAITHAEVNFFPGSQAKKNYLTSLQLQLFNKIFYLSEQNWPAIIEALATSLDQKHMLIYLEDPELFSYLAAENWAGILPRGVIAPDGQTLDFLAVIESNMGANKSNYYLDRNYQLKTSFSKEGKVIHKLVLNYKNNSPSEVFPAGIYKNRLKLYLPIGSKLAKVQFGEEDITSQFSTFVDYGRTGYTSLISINPKEEKQLILDYELAKPLSFKDGVAKYRLDVFKQAGTNFDPFEWNMTYPINFEVENYPQQASASSQEINLSTDLMQDRSFSVNFKQK